MVEAADKPGGIFRSHDARRQLGAPRQRAGAADVLREDLRRSEGRRPRLRADACRRRSPTTAAGRSASSASATSTSTTTPSGSIRTTPITCSWLRRRPLRELRPRPAVADFSQPAGHAVLRRRRRQRVAVLQRLRRHAGQLHARRPVANAQRRTASPTPTGSSSPAATASSPRSTRATRTSSTPSRSTAASSASTARPASASASSRSRGQGEPPLRWNWDSPLIISPHCHTRLYFAANRLFRSDDRGDSWKPISPDLTRQIDRNKLQVMGKRLDAGRGREESVDLDLRQHLGARRIAQARGPALRRHRRRPDPGHRGRRRQLAARSSSSPGVPDTATTGLRAAPRRVAARRERRLRAVRQQQERRLQALRLKSTDRGANVDVDRRRPAGATARRCAFAEDHVDPEPAVRRHRVRPLLHRRRRQEVDPPARHLPTIAVRDLAIQKRENDLVLGTFGRGFYVLDDYSPLRQLSQGTFDRDGHIFPTKPAVIEVPETGKVARFAGRAVLDGREPPARRHHHLLDQGRGAHRCASAGRTQPAPPRQKNASPRYPTQAELTAEADEEAPQTLMTDHRRAGTVVRRLTVPGGRGIHRYVWNLRGDGADHGRRRIRRWWRRRRRTRIRRSIPASPAAAASCRPARIASRCRDASAGP